MLSLPSSHRSFPNAASLSLLKPGVIVSDHGRYLSLFKSAWWALAHKGAAPALYTAVSLDTDPHRGRSLPCTGHPVGRRSTGRLSSFRRLGHLHRSTAYSVSLSLHRAATTQEGNRDVVTFQTWRLPAKSEAETGRRSSQITHINCLIVKQIRRDPLRSAAESGRAHPPEDAGKPDRLPREAAPANKLEPPLSQLQTRNADCSRARIARLCNTRRPTGPLSSESCTGGKELSRRVVPAHLRWNLAGRRVQQSLCNPLLNLTPAFRPALSSDF